MPAFDDVMLRTGLAAANLGPNGAAALAGAGLALLIAGHRGYRFATGIAGGVAGGVAVHLAIALLEPKLPVSSALASAVGGVIGLVAGLLSPMLGMLIVGALVGFAGGRAAIPYFEGDSQRLAVVGGIVAGLFLMGFLASVLPAILPPLVGSAFIGLGAWGAVGASGASPQAFHVPLIWITMTSVFSVVGIGVERMRYSRRASSAVNGTANAEKKQRDEEDRKRVERYMKM